MKLATVLGSLGLLQVVDAWHWDGDHVVNGDAPAKARDWGLRKNHERLSPHMRSLLNNSLMYPSKAGPVHLRQPKLPPPDEGLPEVLRRIRCCNAYASYYSLQVFHSETPMFGGIAYGHCEEKMVAIRVGDPIQLQINNMNEVAFLESSMIDNDDLLLLVAYKDLSTDKLKFKSHMYKQQKPDEDSATVVTMNIYDEGMYYRGWMMQISDDDKAKTDRSETLSNLGRDAVVLVHPGEYVVKLKKDKIEKAKVKFVAKPHGLYSILRIGSGQAKHVDSKGVSDFPNELVVFPHDEFSDKQKNAAWGIHSCSMLSLVTFSALAIILQN